MVNDGDGMVELEDIEVVVFDVLGTLVDEPAGIRAGIRAAVSDADDEVVDALLVLWQSHGERERERIGQGQRTYANSEVIDAEAAQRVAVEAGLTDQATIARLASVGQRLPPWADSVDCLAQLAERFPVLGLSNASHTALLRLNAHAGLRWHQAVSAEAALAYKPAPAVYQLGIATAACAPERILMVAAHAWDLRGAQTQGMRTAYVHRPVGDPPAGSDVFDGQFIGLDGVVAALTAS